ncbi:MAG: DUF120 domain-containing protein [Candidatus Thermoplasmatota archaeon]
MSGVSPTRLAVLKELAILGALHAPVVLTTKELGQRLGMSQQNASAHLIRLAEQGYVVRESWTRRQHVRLTPKAAAALRAEFDAYVRIFSPLEVVEVSGIVCQGMGEGMYYLGRSGYRKEFKRLLGVEPFKGTLNLRVTGRERAVLEILENAEGFTIPGFEEGERTFGPVKCFRAEIRGIKALVAMPSRTHHLDVLELVAPVHLRSRLELQDGDAVRVRVRLTQGSAD